MTPFHPEFTGLPVRIYFGRCTLLNRPVIWIANGRRMEDAIWMTIENRPKLRSLKRKRISVSPSTVEMVKQWVVEHKSALIDDYHFKTGTFETIEALAAKDFLIGPH